MDIITNLRLIIINYTDNFFLYITAIVNLFNQLITSLTCTDYQYIPIVDLGQSGICEETAHIVGMYW